jgi:tRNA nucleotidyltransferase (CCA-adding enzyme)
MLAPRTLVVTHDMADFDALASQVAARKLYPDALILHSPSVGRDVHPYLALHRDRFSGCAPDQVDWGAVQRLIVVDVRRRGRLAHIAPLLERRAREPSSLQVILYDHHPSHPDDLLADQEHIERVGSTTTLLAELIERAGIPLDAEEATLLALGLHADTGSLCYGNSTARDARALAFLLESGVELALASRYLHRPLDVQRRQLVAAVLEATESLSVGGLTVGIARAGAARSLSGLDEVTTRAHESLGCAALLVLYELPRGRVQVIGRSRSPALDLSAVLAELGGGGHPSAGAAVVKQGGGDAVLARVRAALERHAPVTLTARDLMSSPVHTVPPESSLRELARNLASWRHSGACVTREGRVLGVVSRSDLLAAEQRGQLHLGVKSILSQRLVTTTPDTPLESLLACMESEDVGRLPVLEGGRLLGIVTRTDVRRALYGGPQRAGTPSAG